MKRKQAFLFWITGLSGSGKTIIGKKIFRFIYKKFGPTIIVSGDDLRNIFNLKIVSKGYDFLFIISGPYAICINKIAI